MLPEHFPPHQTTYRRFTRFRDDGTREASPSAAVIERKTEAGGPRGYDAGKKVNGRKRQTMADTDGRRV